MARNFASASSQYLTSATVGSAFPFTYACWFNVTNTTAYHYLMSSADTATDTNYFALGAGGAEPGDPVFAEVNASSTYVLVGTSTGYSANTWHHACAVFESATSRSVYIDGGSKGTSTTSRAPAGLDNTTIGSIVLNSAAYYADGLIAEAAIYDVALSDADVLMLAKSVSPLAVKPQSLVAYWPLIGRTSPEIDVVGGFGQTLTNTPTTGAHPRIYYPHSLYIPRFTAGNRRRRVIMSRAG